MGMPPKWSKRASFSDPGGSCAEPLQKSTMIEKIHRASAEAERLRQTGRRRQAFHYQRAHASQAEFAREHQSGRPGADDHNVFNHVRFLSVETSPTLTPSRTMSI